MRCSGEAVCGLAGALSLSVGCQQARVTSAFARSLVSCTFIKDGKARMDRRTYTPTHTHTHTHTHKHTHTPTTRWCHKCKVHKTVMNVI